MLKCRENIFSTSWWLHYLSSHHEEMVHWPFKFWIKTDAKGACLGRPLKI